MPVSSNTFWQGYVDRLRAALDDGPADAIGALAATLLSALQHRNQVFLAGNGGSAGNAIHLANDLLYGMAKESGLGLQVESLTANSSILTCLANDIAYEEVFAEQVRIKGGPGDVLIVLSGSGNSPNIVRALETANGIGMNTFAILGYTGGRCRELAQVPIHFAVDDMQISEDIQLIVGHMCVQWVREQVRQGLVGTA